MASPYYREDSDHETTPQPKKPKVHKGKNSFRTYPGGKHKNDSFRVYKKGNK